MRAKYDIQEYAPRGHVDYGTDESAASLEECKETLQSRLGLSLTMTQSESDRKIRAGCIKVVNTQDERQGTLTKHKHSVLYKPGGKRRMEEEINPPASPHGWASLVKKGKN
ncbi:hypothetical protein PPTG_21535 [Phytophthora nicotianae INRA-310]|uniref:Uncharacterized protein n=1 Tax=Phytophthora nicotianae (strain INRA-310) TaxID=761204 RepID=W2QYY4_PHYN3|nr:hypothetical protein PPTG_21535 [Phytophthora nicotianae INRA-310]ETN18191.1 hypothetical protein PPTG_21535 [Phytophthora nicotianae INRA-310]